MNARHLHLLSAGIWVALLATSSAQLEQKKEPPAPANVPNAPNVPPVPAPPAIPPPAPPAAPNAAPPAAPNVPPKAAPEIQIRQKVIIGNGIILNGVNGINVMNGVVINGGNVIFNLDDGSEPAKPVPDPAGSQVLDYTDGQRLHGTLSSFDPAGGQIIWQRPDAAAPLSIPSAQISRWSFENAPKPESKPGATVKFTGGDWLIANVTAIQGDKVSLQLTDGTKLTTTRAHLEWIYFSKSAAAETYDGPTSLAGWTSGGTWTYRDGALRASSPSPISRVFQSLPDQVEYRLVVDQGETVNAFTLSLHSRGLAMRGLSRGMLQLMLRASTLNLWASIDGNFKSVQVDLTKQLGDPARRAKDSMLFRVFEDVTNGRLLVYINGHKAAEWAIDKSEPGKNGGVFQFQPTSWNGTNEQSISAIRILPWDGRDPGEDEDRTQDSVSVDGGDVKRGKLASWDGHALKLTTEHGPVTVPGEQIGLLRFQRPENPPDDAAPVAHLRLAGQGEFDAVGLDWRDGKFQVRTNFGGEPALSLDPAAVAELEFNRPASKPSPAENMLVFRNGDRLRGSLESADEKGRLLWRASPAVPAVEFAPTFLAGLQFPTRGPGADSGMVARFRNGDWLAGRFLTMDRQQLVFDSAPAGQLTVPRAALKALYFSSVGAPAVSDGVSDHEIWERGLEMNNGTTAVRKKLAETGSPWTYFAGTYSRSRLGGTDVSYARMGGLQLGRIFENMAARVEVSFTVSADRMPVYFSTQIFTEPSNPGYMLHVSNGALSLYDMNPRPRNRGISQQQFPFGKEINPTARERHLRIFADRTSGRLAILVDGILTAQVAPRAADGPRNLGRGVMITPQSNMALTISDLWVGPWNGAVPGKTPETKPSSETVVLANGDEVQGTVELATPSTMKVTSDVGPLDLPMERLTMTDFGGQPIETPPGTHLHLAGAGALTITAWRIENETLICRSEVGGELKLPLKSVQEIVFAPPAAPGK